MNRLDGTLATCTGPLLGCSAISVTLAPLPALTNQRALPIALTVADSAVTTPTAVSVSVAVNGSPVATYTPAADGTVAATLPLVEGVNTIVFSATDGLGGTGATGAQVTLDTQPPSVAVTSPLPGPLLQPPATVVVAAGAPLQVTCSDVTICYGSALGGAEYTVDCPAGTACSCAIASAGAASFQVTCTAGASSASCQGAVITTANCQTTVGTPNVTFSVAVSDASAASVTIGGQTVAAPPGPGGGIVSVPLTLVTGANSVMISAVDAAGNTTSFTQSVFVDSAAPVVTADIASGLMTGALPNDILPVAVQVGEVGASTLTTSYGASYALPRGGGVVNLAVPLVEGNNSFNVLVTNEGGHSATLSLSVTYDKTPPVATLVSPVGGAFARGTIELTADVADALTGVGTVRFLVDAQPIAAASGAPGTWIAPLDTTALTDGAHSLTLSATDGVGNQASSTISFTVDNTPPALALVAPADGASLSGVVTVTATAEDATSGLASIGVSVNGQTVASCTNSPCTTTFDTTTVADGPITFTASAQDAAGNAAAPVQHQASVFNDVLVGFVTSPSAGAIEQQSMTVAVNVVDPLFQSVECSVGGASLGPSANPKFTQLVDLSGQLDGALTVSCSARDSAGHSGVDAVTVEVKNWSERFHPHGLRLHARGEWVTMSVRGPNVGILVSPSRPLSINVPGGTPVPAVAARFHAPEDEGDCEGREPGHVDLKFERAAFVASVRAGIATGAITPRRPVTVSLSSGAHLIGTDSIVVTP